jgi:hypothetical protein
MSRPRDAICNCPLVALVANRSDRRRAARLGMSSVVAIRHHRPDCPRRGEHISDAARAKRDDDRRSA